MSRLSLFSALLFLAACSKELPTELPKELPKPVEVAPSQKVEAPSKSHVAMLPGAKSGATFKDLVAKEIAVAKSKSLKPYLEFTAEWCDPCKAFKASLHDPLMVDAL